MRTGQIERPEFEYIRPGTVNFVVALTVYDGKRHGGCLDANDSEPLCPLLAQLFQHYRRVRRLHRIWDNGPSHISETTRTFLRDYEPWVRVLFTPAHASWLNPSELLLRGFGERYLQRGEWGSRCALIDHLLGSCDAYHRQFACPIAWTWTRRTMRQWVERKTAGLS